MYTINYWDERISQWKGCGAGIFNELNQAKLALRAHSDMCASLVKFKVVYVN